MARTSLAIAIVVGLVCCRGVDAATPTVTAGFNHSCSIDASGSVACWGDNSRGQLGIGTTSTNPVSTPVQVKGLTSPVTALALGWYDSCALDQARSVYCWGANDVGQLGNAAAGDSSSPVLVTAVSSPVAAISSNSGYTCAVMVDGTTKCWGFYPRLSTSFPAGVQAIATGTDHVCVVEIDGRVLCWGSNAYNQLGPGLSQGINSDKPLEVQGLPPSATAIAAGDRHTCVLDVGLVWCWGNNSFGQLGDGSDPLAVPQKAEPDFALITDVVALSGATSHTCALTSQGTVSCWGANYNGELGNGGALSYSPLPVQVTALPVRVAKLSSFQHHNCVTSDQGVPLCWGKNVSAQLGDGTLANGSTPKVVRREGGAGAVASNDWYHDLNPSVQKVIPAALTPTFLMTAQGTTTSTIANVIAQVQFRATDVGNPIYVYGYVPANRVTSLHAPASAKDGTPSCVLVQLSPDGQAQLASASSLQSYLAGVLGTQQQAVNILNNVAASAVAAGTFCVGSAATGTQAVSTANSQCVASIPSPNDTTLTGATPVCLPTTSANLPAALSGLWWNPNESGWGITFTQRRNIVFAAWYAYDAAGNPKWYVASSCAFPSGVTGASGTCTGVLYEVNGPTFFGAPFDTSRVNVATAGNLQVAFQNANDASMTYTVAGQTRTVAITRQVFQNGTTPPIVDYTDLWWNPNESGWGITITQQYGVMFLTWYVYDGNGKPVWYVASDCAVSGGGNSCAGTLYRTTGPVFGPTFNPASVQIYAAGTVTLTFDDPNNGTLSYTVNGVTANKTITRQLF